METVSLHTFWLWTYYTVKIWLIFKGTLLQPIVSHLMQYLKLKRNELVEHYAPAGVNLGSQGQGHKAVKIIVIWKYLNQGIYTKT